MPTHFSTERYNETTSALARDTSIDPLTDYVQFRSNLDLKLVSRHATYIPSPVRAVLPTRRSDQQPLTETPLISVLIPAYESHQGFFTTAVNSVRAQTYLNWELVVVDDGSSKCDIRKMIENISYPDPRIQQVRLDTNSGIAEATNTALRLSKGEFIALLDHDDVLVPNALEEMVRTLLKTNADVAYSDQAYVSASNDLDSTFYKPNWSPTLFSGVMYIGHLLVVRRELALAVGTFDSNYDRVQDFEFMLRVSERTKRVVHVPQILYHWRRAPGSIAHDANSAGKD